MSNYIYTNDGLVNVDELAHYGVPGMRWGHRKNRYAGVSTDGSKKRAAEKARQDLIASKRNKKSLKDKAFDRYEKTILDIEKGYKRGQNLSKKDQARELKAEEQYGKAILNIDASHKAAKQAYKAAKKMANLEAKAVKHKYKEEYMKGSSVAGKLYAMFTDSHKTYASMMYDINNGAYKAQNTDTKKLAKIASIGEKGVYYKY